jgi:lipid II:glycine glycyltransferase (peptidoglycan interpeptide bridge formation enzyme)
VVVAASLVFRHRERAHYHLAGSAPEALRQGANNLLLWTILRWAAEAGCAVVHLGGGVRPDDGLFTFKRSLGGTRTAFWTGAVVPRPDRYQALLAARAGELGRSVDELRNTGFFPAYRLERS